MLVRLHGQVQARIDAMSSTKSKVEQMSQIGRQPNHKDIIFANCTNIHLLLCVTYSNQTLTYPDATDNRITEFHTLQFFYIYPCIVFNYPGPSQNK